MYKNDNSFITEVLAVLGLLGGLIIFSFSIGCAHADIAGDLPLYAPLPPYSVPLQGWAGKTDKILSTTVKVCSLYDTGTGWGTGIIRGKYIVTEYHVVAPSSRGSVVPGIGGIMPEAKESEYRPDVKILYPGSTKLVDAEIVLLDKSSDLAILRASYRGADKNETAPFAEARPGDRVVAIGNPVDGDFVTATAKVVGRLPFRRQDGSVALAVLLTADGGIQGGFSGGGVFSEKGLIGAVEWCMPEANVCGAIPSSEIKRELGRLKQ